MLAYGPSLLTPFAWALGVVVVVVLLILVFRGKGA